MSNSVTNPISCLQYVTTLPAFSPVNEPTSSKLLLQQPLPNKLKPHISINSKCFLPLLTFLYSSFSFFTYLTGPPSPVQPSKTLLHRNSLSTQKNHNPYQNKPIHALHMLISYFPAPSRAILLVPKQYEQKWKWLRKTLCMAPAVFR